jgi:hypothetical protein
MALAIETEARPHDALMFAESLRQGANGIAPMPTSAATPATGATRVLSRRDPATAATSVAQRTGSGPATASTRARPARQLEPRHQPTGAYARPARERPRERRRSGRAASRFVALLALLCVIVAAVVVAVVIATGASSTAVQFRKTVANDFSNAYNQVQGLINQYTK